MLISDKAVTDFPAALFAPELIKAYPEAKLILSNRDVDKWYKYGRPRLKRYRKDAELSPFRSAQETLDWLHHDRVLFALTLVDHPAAAWGRMWYKTWTCFNQGDFRTHGKQAYNDHCARVRSLAPADNLLEYHVTQGWKPLCKFLDVDIPTVPFPSGNEQDSFYTQMKAFDKSRTTAVLTKTTP